MPDFFYEKPGSLLSPGDIYRNLPYIRVMRPLRVARKPSQTLPKGFQGRVKGELREIFEAGEHILSPPISFAPPGEEVLVNAKIAKAIFLTWGSEVEDDQRRGSLHKKDWLIAPVFPLADLKGTKVPSTEIYMVDAIVAGMSPRFFPLEALPGSDGGDYVDFRKICSLSANYFEDSPREWRLGPKALNGFYHHLIWFFTRKKIFFEPLKCTKCGELVDLEIAFEGQPLEPDTNDPDSPL
jgi:hypothetical protein